MFPLSNLLKIPQYRGIKRSVTKPSIHQHRYYSNERKQKHVDQVYYSYILVLLDTSYAAIF
jgi:hypothetical protein